MGKQCFHLTQGFKQLLLFLLVCEFLFMHTHTHKIEEVQRSQFVCFTFCLWSIKASRTFIASAYPCTRRRVRRTKHLVIFHINNELFTRKQRTRLRIDWEPLIISSLSMESRPVAVILRTAASSQQVNT